MVVLSPRLIKLKKIQVILKIYKDAYNSNINFSIAKSYELKHIKTELIGKDKWNGHNFLLKHLEVILVTIFNNSNWDKIRAGIIKKRNLEHSDTPWEVKR